MKKNYNPPTSSKTELVTFRCPKKLKELMDQAVKDGKYQTITALTVEAVKDKLQFDPDSDV
ncbi:hypothetical protein [Shewanella morhuae]|nr:hypothetical protein [Shewanella morhuae]